MGVRAVTIVGIGGPNGSELRADYRPQEGAEEPQRAVVLVETQAGGEGFAERAAQALRDAGFAVLILDASNAESRGDRGALSDIESALAWLAERGEIDPQSLAVVGAGHGGTLAFLVGCTSRQVAAVASIGGPVEYEALSATRPAQPIELHLNLDRPLLLVDKEPGGVAIPEDQLERLTERLQAGHKNYVRASEDEDARELVRFLEDVL